MALESGHLEPDNPTSDPAYREAMADDADVIRRAAAGQYAVIVTCVCGRHKQQGFICDFCYSTEELHG